jgi:MoaA/NifB/PqqE/SkfB family radical SAM enzyme
MVAKNAKQKAALFFLNQVEKKMMHDVIAKNTDDRPLINRQYRAAMGTNIIKLMKEWVSAGDENPHVKRAISKVLLNSIFFGTKEAKNFRKKNGYVPPKFITLAILAWCNLNCYGCYANAARDELLARGEKISSWMETGEHVIRFDVLNRIIDDAKKNFGARFFVITGGEPFFYKSQGHSIYDLFAKHQDCYFLVYTNGVMLSNEENAKKVAKLGNVTPAFSVEGFREETEKRRGPIYDKILKAMDNMKKGKVPFGISFTITRQNVDTLLNPEKKKRFIDFYFRDKGAAYMWGFQYMPIGRGIDFSLTLTPEQRANLLDVEKEIIFKDKIFFADFWNSALASDGCISAGRGGGHFYIDWDGFVYPCPFNPFRSPTLNNVYELYKQGKKLTDALNTPYFKAIRKWIDDYGYKKPASEMKNQYAPCMVRDHFSCADCGGCGGLKCIVKETGAMTNYPEMLTEKYAKKMGDIALAYKKLTQKKWEKDRARNS